MGSHGTPRRVPVKELRKSAPSGAGPPTRAPVKAASGPTPEILERSNEEPRRLARGELRGTWRAKER